jgi:ribosome-associated protein
VKSKDFAALIAKVASEKRAEDLVIIDLRKFSAPAEFFVIASANSEPHLKAIADHLENELRKIDAKCIHRDGIRGSEWLVLDFFDVIVHLFSGRKREYYAIEELYADAPLSKFVPEPDEKKVVAKKVKKIVKKVAKKAVKKK